MARFFRCLRITNILIVPTNYEDTVKMVREAEVGDIFDFRIFRAIEGATTMCAHLTLRT